jgi:hypothetical protein
VKSAHIARGGIHYRELNGAGEVPEQVTSPNFDDDGVTPRPKSPTPGSRLPFCFPRYQFVTADVANDASDHCPVKVWS